MRTHKKKLEIIANDFLDQTGLKPNYSNRDFMNTLLIFQVALMDKMYNNQDYDEMDLDNRMKMALNCVEELRKLIHTYTGLDTHNFNDFL